MNHKRLAVLALLVTILAFPASASVVSFLLVETGLTEDSSSQYSSLWEGGLMEAFFDAGHIVTNSPIIRMDAKPPQDLSGTIDADFLDAVEGGAEYFILGYLEFRTQGQRAVPAGIALKVYDTRSRRLVFEQGFQAGTGRSLNEEYQIAQNTGRVIISHLKGR